MIHDWVFSFYICYWGFQNNVYNEEALFCKYARSQNLMLVPPTGSLIKFT